MIMRIVSTEKSALNERGHDHISAVGVEAKTSRAGVRQTVEAVRAGLLAGEVYYTASPSTGELALVHRVDCSCGVRTIRSAPNAIIDNNLDSLQLVGRG